MSSRSGAPHDHARRLGSTRREFLKRGATAVGGVALPGLTARAMASLVWPRASKSVIFVYLAGGPSHLDVYDMRPDAPAEIRGEFRPIQTNVPGVRVCEHLPLHAKIADKFAIVNGVETIDSHGLAVVTTGSPTSPQRTGLESISAVHIEHLDLPHGDWDTHGRVLGRQLTIFQELREKLPAYDAAIHRLVNDIYEHGLDKDILLVACGEFGRTPWINEHGGRNHWAPCGSVLFAGGGLKMGQVIGATNSKAEEPVERGMNSNCLLATIYRRFGINPAQTLPDRLGRPMAILPEGEAIRELF